MAPTETMSNTLTARYYYYTDDSDSWIIWGRWVLVGALVFLLLLTSTCISISRRRRRSGLQPYYGTGWMAGRQRNYDAQNAANGYPINGYPQPGYPQPGPDGKAPPAYVPGQQANTGYYAPAPPPEQFTYVQQPPNAHFQGPTAPVQDPNAQAWPQQK